MMDRGTSLEGHKQVFEDPLEGNRSGSEPTRPFWREETLTKALTESCPTFFMIVDSSGKILFMNDAMLGALGYTRDGAAEQECPIIPEAERDRFRTMLSEASESGEGREGRIPILGRSGKEIWVEWTIVPGRGRQGEAEIYYGFGRDVSEATRMARERERLEAQLHRVQKMEAIGALVGGISHDFNNILSAIIGYTQLGLMQVGKDTPAGEYLGEVLKAGRRAGNLANQLLKLARHKEETLRPTYVTPIIKEAIKLFRASLPETVEMRQDIKDERITVKSDPTQLYQILMNLCTNAADAMESSGGVLTVEVSKVDLDSDALVSHPDIPPGSFLRLRVTDTGTGVAPEIMDRIFEPYFTTKPMGKGTGLGLAVTQRIVDRHGGFLTASSEPEKGSVFQVFLPCTETRSSESLTEKSDLPAGSERVLFVDDERDVVDVVRQMLEQLGYQVETETQSGRALSHFRAGPYRFDLVITDVRMPHLSGDQLAREMIRIRPDIPIILCTGYTDRFNEKKAKSLGAREFILKPISIEDLAEKIRRTLDYK